jgi:hypothetical protein
VLTASAVGAPHRRARLFVVAWEVSDAGRLALGVLAERGVQHEAERRHPQPGDVGPSPGWGCAVGVGLADSDSPGRPGLGVEGDGRGRAGARGDEPDGRGEAAPGLEHSVLQGREGGGPPDARGWAWPPGPSDSAGWREVLARSPGLAPAVPAVRRVAHGAAGPLDAEPTWADRLRCLGNAVVPAQATAAVAALARRALTCPQP